MHVTWFLGTQRIDPLEHGRIGDDAAFQLIFVLPECIRVPLAVQSARALRLGDCLGSVDVLPHDLLDALYEAFTAFFCAEGFFKLKLKPPLDGLAVL